ncbi:MAG: D-tyrosyl-tRNA(Tyr) deacylase [Acidimicrobiia bacterium]|nr:D-tyrosyl-tRNA(Tyr) deacylase [Acidimicrobiia bacterium]
MRAVVQRVTTASVSTTDGVAGSIGAGLAVLVGASDQDDESDAIAVADKLVGLRIFADEAGKMNRSVADVGGAVLIVSQFTLLADIRKGRRPSFVHAAEPAVADALVQAVVDRVAGHGVQVETGEFGAHMVVDIVNDGPVTIVIDTVDGRVQ